MENKGRHPGCSSLSAHLLFFLLCFLLPGRGVAQQEYENNKQLACDATNASSVLGYSCNGRASFCSSYLSFRSSSPLYDSPLSISYLLSVSPSAVSSLNDDATLSPLHNGTLVVAPATCSCAGPHYQHNASFSLYSGVLTYFIVANNTYQGLTTCQALAAQNPYPERSLTVGINLTVPLRCACPTAAQAAAGFKYLLTYLVTWGDDVPTIAARFGSDYNAVLDANELTTASSIYPFTTLLVPLKSEPNASTFVSPPPPPPPSPPPPPPTGGGSKTSKWVFVGIGIAVGFLALAAILAGLLCFYRRRLQKQRKPNLESAEYGEIRAKTPLSSPPLISGEIRNAIESLTVYKYVELEKATGLFDEGHRIKGSVYRGVINGDAAAIKRVKSDVSHEINILKHVNHANVIRLSGFCLHGGDSFLVYEFAENGSLADWLHGREGGAFLGWRQRVQAAHDVADGLNYLHNYTSPPYVHKNLTSSNVLLDGDLRAKVANFGLARAVADVDGGEAPQLTRHVVGTQGYMAPEYLEHGLITPQLDVFAFGVVLLELLSGKEAAFTGDGDEKRETMLWEAAAGVLSGEDVRSKLRSFMDPCLQSEYPFELAFAMAELAVRCVAREPGARPAMGELLVSLSAIYSSTVDWDPSVEYGNSGSNVYAR